MTLTNQWEYVSLPKFTLPPVSPSTIGTTSAAMPGQRDMYPHVGCAKSRDDLCDGGVPVFSLKEPP